MEDHRWGIGITRLWKILVSSILFLTLSEGARGQDCFFRNDLCGWSNEGAIDWVQRSPSAGMGAVHCAEASIPDTLSGSSQAVLTSPLQPHVMTMLGFYYRLVAPNTLTVVSELDDGSVVHVWSRNGTNGTSWIEVDVPVPKSKAFKISFKAFIPENSTSFVGITNLTLRIGADECASMPCKHGGDCIDGNNSYTCVCGAGFRGETCQIDLNAPPKTTQTAIQTTISTASQTTVSTPRPTTIHVSSTTKYGTISTPAKLPQTGDKTALNDPVIIAVIAVASIILIATILTVTWLLVYYVKKRSWHPRYHDGGLSMESVSNAKSPPGKWTSTVDIPGSIPTLKQGELPPVEENSYPRKVENIYVSPPTLGLVNTGYNLDNTY